MSVSLSLEDAGWEEVDAATLRAKGNVHEVISQMQATLDRPEVVALCRNLGLYSAGFLFFDRFRRLVRFFRVADETPPTYATRYISPGGDLSDEEFEDIHSAFLLLRDKQAKWTKAWDLRRAGLPPEYVRCLPGAQLARQIAGEEGPLRDRYQAHYCTLGEMVTTSFLWRALSLGHQNGLGEVSLDEALPLPLDRTFDDATVKWDDLAVFERLREVGTTGALEHKWNARFATCLNWSDQWSALGLKGTNAPTLIRAALRFCKAIDGVDEGDLGQEAVNRRLSAALRPLLERLGCPKPPSTVNGARAELERFARFPLLPFFLWNAVDSTPQVYCVTPVWTSQGYSILGQPHLGLALTAMSPNRELDWSLPETREGEAAFVSDVDPALVSSLLRLAARPLVEHSVYGVLIRMAETENDKTWKVRLSSRIRARRSRDKRRSKKRP